MEIEMLATKTRKRCDRDLADTLIAAGLAVEIKPLTSTRPIPNLTFAAVRGPVEGDYDYPPSINHYCTMCGLKGYCTSQKGRCDPSNTTDRLPDFACLVYLMVFLTYRIVERRGRWGKAYRQRRITSSAGS
jgi:hypothetical protein